jgi:hypothetical protein
MVEVLVAIGVGVSEGRVVGISAAEGWITTAGSLPGVGDSKLTSGGHKCLFKLITHITPNRAIATNMA